MVELGIVSYPEHSSDGGRQAHKYIKMKFMEKIKSC